MSSPSPRDLLLAEIESTDGYRVKVGNVYNAPVGCESVGGAVSAIIHQVRPKARWLIAGDFNLPHGPWIGDDG